MASAIFVTDGIASRLERSDTKQERETGGRLNHRNYDRWGVMAMPRHIPRGLCAAVRYMVGRSIWYYGWGWEHEGWQQTERPTRVLRRARRVEAMPLFGHQDEQLRNARHAYHTNQRLACLGSGVRHPRKSKPAAIIPILRRRNASSRDGSDPNTSSSGAVGNRCGIHPRYEETMLMSVPAFWH